MSLFHDKVKSYAFFPFKMPLLSDLIRYVKYMLPTIGPIHSVNQNLS